MTTIHRLNSLGLSYYLVAISDAQTMIRYKDKKIIVNHPLERMNSAWHVWMNGKFVQEAFHFLTSAEREFLKTGLTESEWNTIFKDITEVE